MNSNLKKLKAQLNNVIVYDIETYNKERAIPLCNRYFIL